MTTIRATTEKVRHVAGDAEAYVCASNYFHPRERRFYFSVGAGASAEGARADLARLLRAEGVTRVQLIEEQSEELRAKAIRGARAKAIVNDAEFVVVEESVAHRR